MAADWRILNKNIYIDLDSLVKLDNETYQFWIMSFDDKTDNSAPMQRIRTRTNNNFAYSQSLYLINICNKSFSIKAIYIYDKNLQIIESGELNNTQLEWTYIPPDSMANVMYDIVIGRYIPPRQEDVIMNPFFSVFLSIVCGFIITCILACTIFPIFIYRPVMPTIDFAYVLHPLFRFKFNTTLAYPKWYTWINRYIIIHIITSIIYGLSRIGNNMATQGG